MASDLKWRTGFDWGSVVLLTASVLGAGLLPGWPRVLLASVATLAALFMLAQYRKWNGSGWHSVHFRAMLAYANAAGAELARSRADGNAFDRAVACRKLALMMCDADKTPNVDAMISALQIEQGNYLASLLRRHANDLLPSADDDQIQRFLATVAQVEFGPQLVICNVVENSFGSLEAARYALALVTKEAH